MVVETRVFGAIDIDEEKIITFADGIIGFPALKQFTLIYDAEQSQTAVIKWLQSLDEPDFAIPVMDPLFVKESYNPVVEDELLKPLGELNPEDILVMVTVSVPKELEKMSVNLQAPIVINAGNKAACQMIIDNESGEYPIKYMVYDILKEKKERAGE